MQTGRYISGGDIRVLETHKGYQDDNVFGLVRHHTDGGVDKTLHPWGDTLSNSIDSSGSVIYQTLTTDCLPLV